MLFLANELAKKAEITILPARNITRPGLQAGASWFELVWVVLARPFPNKLICPSAVCSFVVKWRQK